MTEPTGPAVSGSTASDAGVRKKRRLRIRTPTDRWGFVTATLLGLATLATAWCSYQASRWGGEAARDTRAATMARFEATRAGEQGDRQLTIDVMSFTSWLEADLSGNDRLADALIERFRPELGDAFEVWMRQATDDELPQGTPLQVPEYVRESSETEVYWLARAEQLSNEVARADDISDAYVLVAVVYATVLFLAGISSKLADPLEHPAIVAAAVAFVLATIVMFVNPIDSGGFVL